MRRSGSFLKKSVVGWDLDQNRKYAPIAVLLTKGDFSEMASQDLSRHCHAQTNPAIINLEKGTKHIIGWNIQISRRGVNQTKLDVSITLHPMQPRLDLQLSAFREKRTRKLKDPFQRATKLAVKLKPRKRLLDHNSHPNSVFSQLSFANSNNFG